MSFLNSHFIQSKSKAKKGLNHLRLFGNVSFGEVSLDRGTLVSQMSKFLLIQQHLIVFKRFYYDVSNRVLSKKEKIITRH